MDAVQMPAVQGESIELFSRLRTAATCRPPPRGSLRGVERLNSSSISMIARPATSGENRPTTKLGDVPVCGSHTTFEEEVQEPEGGEAESSPLRLSPECQGGEKGDGGEKSTRSSDAEGNEAVNEAKTKLLGDYLRRHLLSNMPTKDPAKELVKRSFRHLHRGQGHVLTLAEFREGLANTFGAPLSPQLIHATFDIFDTEPKTWQLDFDEFCHWLETGQRVLNSHGISNHPKSRGWVGTSAASESKARKPRANDASGDFNSSMSDAEGKGVNMSMEQTERAALKAHLMKHRTRLHRNQGLSEAQKAIVDHILLEKLMARVKKGFSSEEFNGLEAFTAMSRGSDRLAWPDFKRQINALVPNLRAESDIRELFARMDHNGDGLIDLADFLMWEERMEDGKAKTDFWALQEEEHLQQIKLARNKASNLLVPDDYDGSTYHARLARDQAKVVGWLSPGRIN